jgi:hypothetical protein
VDGEWTLAELVARVAQALAAADVRAPNGRVTEFPDGRVVRWYTTIGLVDRPSAVRGRTALYGLRHLLQLVAVKRRQAQGRTLAEVQTELMGATDDALRAIAAIPTEGHAGPDVQPATEVQAAEVQAAEAGPSPLAPRRPSPRRPSPRRPSPLTASEWVPPARSRFWAEPPAPASRDGVADGVAVLHGVRLDGATLLLPAVPDADDLAAIHAAAQPLLDLLRNRGLLTPRSEGAPA